MTSIKIKYLSGSKAYGLYVSAEVVGEYLDRREVLLQGPIRSDVSITVGEGFTQAEREEAMRLVHEAMTSGDDASWLQDLERTLGDFCNKVKLARRSKPTGEEV